MKWLERIGRGGRRDALYLKIGLLGGRERRLFLFDSPAVRVRQLWQPWGR
jgi:hypothetical protein